MKIRYAKDLMKQYGWYCYVTTNSLPMICEDDHCDAWIQFEGYGLTKEEALKRAKDEVKSYLNSFTKECRNFLNSLD